MPDICDQASSIEQKARDRGIHAVRATIDLPGSSDCVDCGDTIPEARRQANPAARRCLDCQEFAERK